MSSDPSIRPSARPSIAPARAVAAVPDGPSDACPDTARAPSPRAGTASRSPAPPPRPGRVGALPGVALTALLASGAFAQTPTGPAALLNLPALANTPDGDRRLLREMDDEHVHVPVLPVPVVPADAAASASTGVAAILPPAPAGTRSADVSAPDAGSGAGARALPGTDPVAVVGTVPPVAASTALAALAALAPADAWSRIRDAGRLPERRDHPEVAALREEYLAESPWVTRILERGTPYLKHMVDELDRRYLPLGLAVLPAIESGFRPDVQSSGGAAGLWQIVPITADEIGLERSLWFDARSDILASTTAALDYLSYLNAEFDGDWELTLAAYNAGPGRVRGAMRANAATGRPLDFWSLALPPETRRYVPKVLALVSLLREDPSPIRVPDLDGDGFERVDLGLRISVDRAAALSGIPEDTLRKLNAGLVHGVTAPEGPHALYVPLGTADDFRARIAEADTAALYSLPLTHEVAPGETLSGIAYRYGISQAELMSMNAMSEPRLQAGARLAVIDVRRAGTVDVEYVVGAGDTLSAIAETHAVGLGAISRADGAPLLADDLIHPGQTLSISVGDPGARGDDAG